MTTTPKIWFITGASSGFGRAMTELVLRNGDIAIATLRKPAMLDSLVAQYPPTQLLVLELDVSKPEEITRAFSRSQEVFGRIDVVFNNAGYGVVGEMESCPDAAVRAMFDVLFWGAVDVTREAIKFFREVNRPMGGRLLQNSSVAGLTCLPMSSFYSAAKHALEGFSKSVDGELDPTWNIKITLVEATWFRTDVLGRSLVLTEPHPAYVGPTSRTASSRKWLESDPKVPGDTVKATAVIYRVAAMPNPPLQFVLGQVGIDSTRDQIAALAASMDQYESWSEGLDFED